MLRSEPSYLFTCFRKMIRRECCRKHRRGEHRHWNSTTRNMFCPVHSHRKLTTDKPAVVIIREMLLTTPCNVSKNICVTSGRAVAPTDETTYYLHRSVPVGWSRVVPSSRPSKLHQIRRRGRLSCRPSITHRKRACLAAFTRANFLLYRFLDTERLPAL